MPTRVRNSRSFGVMRIFIRLVDGQCIHVCAERDGRATILSLYITDDTRSFAPSFSLPCLSFNSNTRRFYFNPALTEILLNFTSSFYLLPTKFGMFMKINITLLHFRLEFSNPLQRSRYDPCFGPAWSI